MHLTETAYVKINLALHVRGRRVDGYHELETLFAFAADGDVLTAGPNDSLALTITGPFAEGLEADDGNLVLQAAKALQAASGTRQGASIILDKRLPIASGIGGGSADAAAALRLLSKLWILDIPDEQWLAIASGLGADVPACLRSETVFGSGVGEQLTPFETDSISGVPILLVNPLKPCPTGPVFKSWDGIDRGALDPQYWRDARNDLEPPAIAMVPEISEVLAMLKAQAGATLVRMSGSGATCFGLFETETARDAAANTIRTQQPGWWQLPTVLR